LAGLALAGLAGAGRAGGRWPGWRALAGLAGAGGRWPSGGRYLARVGQKKGPH